MMVIGIQVMVVVQLVKFSQTFLVWWLLKDFLFVGQAVEMGEDKVQNNAMILMLLLGMDALTV